MTFDEAVEAIRAERQRQDNKWGHTRWNPDTWIRIALEEFGEIAQLVNTDMSIPTEELQKERIQLAAVIVAWLESDSWAYPIVQTDYADE